MTDGNISQNLIEEVQITRYKIADDIMNSLIVTDKVINETYLRIFVNNKELTSIMTINKELIELALGFLNSECLLNSFDEVNKIELDAKALTVHIDIKNDVTPFFVNRMLTVTSGCSSVISYVNPLKLKHLEQINSDKTINAGDIIALMQQFQTGSELFKETGSVHSAALSDGKTLLHLTEDIGRHNCIDKIVGLQLERKLIPLSEQIVISTGRISSEIIIKAIRGKIPILISSSAPNNLSIGLAKKYNITLIGFARGKRFNVYSGNFRVA